MDFAYDLGGASAPFIKKYQAGEAMALRGVPVVVGGSGQYGILKGSTTAAANLVGVTLDTVTPVTSQQTDFSDTERLVSVCVSPLAVYRARLAGSATSGAALTLYDETTGSTTGLIVTTGDSFSNFDEGAIWGYDGANAGIARKIITGDGTNADVGVPFPRDIAIGDNFLRAPFWPGSEIQYVQLTTLLNEVDASATVDTDNANFIPVDATFADQAAEGTLKSYVFLVAADHLFASS